MIRIFLFISSLIVVIQSAKAQTDSQAVPNEPSLEIELPSQLEDSINHLMSITPDSTFLQSDSLKQEAKSRLTTEAKTQAGKKGNELKKEHLLDELGVLNTEGKLDSTLIKKTGEVGKEIALDTLQNTKLGKFTNITQITLPRDSAGNISKDSLVARGKKKAIETAEGAVKNTDEFKELESLNKEAEAASFMEEQDKLASMQKSQAEEARDKMKQKMIDKGKDFMTDHIEEISKLQSEMTKLKQKYSGVIDKNDLKSATSKNSLKGEPFFNRFVFGGNFNINSRVPFLLDLSPLLGYKVDKKCQFGLSATFRQSFDDVRNGLTPKEPVFGYSFFGNYIFYKQFFAYLEGGRLSKVSQINEEPKRVWEDNLLVGIGLNIKISKWISMQSIISYNVLHHYTDQLTHSPYVFKTGIRFNKGR